MTPLARRARWVVEILLPICVFMASLNVFVAQRQRSTLTRGTGSERRVYFQRFFVERDFSEDAWADGYWARTQPMVFRYLIGSWLWWRGHDLPA